MKVLLLDNVLRGLQGLVMLLVGYGSNNNWLRIEERVEWVVWHSDFNHLYQRLPVSSQSVEDTVIVNTFIPVNASGKQGETKTVSLVTRLPCSGAVLPEMPVLEVLKICYWYTVIKFV